MTLVRLLFVLSVGACLAQASQPTFFARKDYSSATCIGAILGTVVTADVNEDGVPDVICQRIQLGVGNGTFRTGPQLPSANEWSNWIAADVNGDGHVDLAFATMAGQVFGIGVMLGRGNGGFASPITYPGAGLSSVYEFGQSLASGDFNRDGVPDFALLGTGGVQLFLGIAGGGYNVSAPIFLPFGGSDSSIAIAAGDFNRDGLLDLIVDAKNSLYVLPGNGNGTFQSPISTLTPANAGYGSMAVGDLNMDGSLDIALGNVNSSSVLLFPGKGNGKFGAPINVASMGGYESLLIADVNGDGVPDLLNSSVAVAFGKGNWKFATPTYYAVNETVLASNPSIGVSNLRKNGRLDVLGGSADLSVLLNGGRGKLEDGIQTPVAGGKVACSASGDFNRDGIPDLAISNNSIIEIYLGTGNSLSPYEPGAAYSLDSPDCPVAGDLNNDGLLDLLVPAGPGISSPGTLVPLLGNGDGTFQPGSPTGVSTLGFFTLADFNGDGILDYASTTNEISYGKGDGTFGPVSGYETYNSNCFGIASADLNGDGKPDIVLTGFNDFTVYVLLNSGKGKFQASLLTQAGKPSYLTLADVNGDGSIDLVISNGSGLSLYFNNGLGIFGTPQKLQNLSTDTGIPVVMDVNGDGIPDISFLGASSIALFLGEGAGGYSVPSSYLGVGNVPSSLFVLNAHGQNPGKGTPDLVVADGAGVIYTLLNETK